MPNKQPDPQQNSSKKRPKSLFKRVLGFFGAKPEEDGDEQAPTKAADATAPKPDRPEPAIEAAAPEPASAPEAPAATTPEAPVAERPAEDPPTKKRLSPAQKRAAGLGAVPPARGGLSPAKRAEERRTRKLERPKAESAAAPDPSAEATDYLAIELPPPPTPYRSRGSSSRGEETERMVRPSVPAEAAAEAPEPVEDEALEAETLAAKAEELSSVEKTAPTESEAVADAEAVAVKNEAVAVKNEAVAVKNEAVVVKDEAVAVEREAEAVALAPPAPDIMARLEDLPTRYASNWVKLSMVDPERIQVMWDLEEGWSYGGEPALRLRRHVGGVGQEMERIVGFIGPAGDWYFSVAPGSLYDVELGLVSDGRFEVRHRSAFLRTPVIRPRFSAPAVWRVRHFAPPPGLKPKEIWSDPLWQGEPALAAAEAQTAGLVAAHAGAGGPGAPSEAGGLPAWLAVNAPFDGPIPELAELAAWRGRPEAQLPGPDGGPRDFVAPRLRRRWLGGSEFRLEGPSDLGGASFVHQAGSEAARE